MRATGLTRALPWLGVLAAIALLASQALAWWGLDRAAGAAERGEAQVMLDAFELHLSGLERRPEEEDLRRFFARHEANGLRFVALEGPGPPLEVGAGRLEDPPLPSHYALGSGRVRAVAHLPPRTGRPPPPSKAPPDDRGSPPRGGPPPIPRAIVEVEPRHGAALRADARRTMVGSALFAALFVALTFALRRSIRAREAGLIRSERDRRLAALGEMSGVVAHELRSPLTALKGHAQLLTESLPEGGKARAKAERLVHEAERMQHLTTSLLEFVRSGDLHPASTDLAELIRRVVDDTGVEVELALPEGGLSAEVDATRLSRALGNLVSNAAQARQDWARVTLSEVGGDVHIEVADDGPGVAVEDRERIFEPFFTKRAAGTGLGLAIARRIVESHGGTLDVRPRPEGGSVFQVTLPRRARKDLR